MLKETSVYLTAVLVLVGAIAHAGVIEGKVRQIAATMALVDTGQGVEVIAMEKGATYKNLKSLSALEKGGIRVRATYDREVSGVKIVRELEALPEAYFDPEMAISTAEIKSFFSNLKTGPYLLIDSRERGEWEAGHIPDAVSIPDTELKDNPGKLPADKDTLLIFYSESALSPISHESARKALRLGYSSVKVYTEGLEGWREGGNPVMVSASHLAKLIEKKAPLLVVDARGRERAAAGRIPDALAISPEEMRHEDIFIDGRVYQYPLFFYGEDGGDRRGGDAAARAVSWGYHQDGVVSIVEGGFREWVKSGSPKETGEPKIANIYAPAPGSGEIGYEEFQRLWRARGDGSVVILNVKGKNDRHFDRETHIPLEELHLRLSELPRDREIVLYCNYGLRATVANHILQKNGFRVRSLNRFCNITPDGTIHD